jgi:ABC-type multidrug transport system ATPase subunit
MRPDYGVVIYDGERLLRSKLWGLARRGLFFLPERGLLRQNWTCGEHFAALAHHFEDTAIDQAAERLAVSAFDDRKRRTLSGGEARRVELAMAMARKPRCLVADEPFLGIAPKDAALIGEVLREMAAAGVAIIVTGHEVRYLLDLADEVIWHTAGTTHVLGDRQAAEEHFQFRQEYLAGKMLG